MSGPQGTDPNQGGQGPQHDPSATTNTPWQAPSSWQQPTNTDDQATGIAPTWQRPPGPDATTAAPAWGQGYQPGAQQSYPGYQGAPGYSAPPSTPGYPAQPGYGQFGAQPTQYGAQPGQPQYGQYPGQPQYGAQPGYPGQPGQPGQYGFPPPGAEPEAKSKRTLLIIIGAILAALLLIVLVTGFWKPGFFVTTTLDVNKAQQGVQQILSDETNGYGAKNVQDVKCNNGKNPEVHKGDTFTCEVSIDGAKRQVTVTFQDNNGTYEVGRPK
ncbi:DUF4333 domain-containing protein [Mycolicibacterium brumae]|uniref:DUF4333 domain-containing protein n=1 Tax=Mycolicibacterium brumae TaxID=85968 RepID=A0A2G5PA30_9MYCO|nr:DUF4333 domain-containing protein [Mycolicibacterium brumae]MCV7192944.1 DUF4333 domain-containing protein [Mycolicibacterium brumae]PIB75218.1 DUF4333 domain-containing protein [Mycolicibacterium brumae]RWA23533.1 hypothetical protein MBRU_01530 [Mycolicibacterium brumae DSM 44177]UWW08537.1 DUF4333 domain-containing protein [Mycolicibacterium brumae]